MTALATCLLVECGELDFPYDAELTALAVDKNGPAFAVLAIVKNAAYSPNLRTIIARGDKIRAAILATTGRSRDILAETRRILRWVHETRAYWHAHS